MDTDEFEDRLQAFRPRLHRYCARMTGSTVDGEDMVQDTLVKALRAKAAGLEVENLEAWLLRIAHNTCLDFLRHTLRNAVVAIVDEIEAEPPPDTEIVSVSFHAFLQLPELQRCAVILKDVLGHSVEEVATIAGCSPAAAKSALQRGRATLRQLSQLPDNARHPLLSGADRQKMATYVRLFQGGDFDLIRTMLADDVKLDLVNRLKLTGRDEISRYFTRYAEETKWRFAFGTVEGRTAMLVFDIAGPTEKPAHFVFTDWQGDKIVAIRDFLFAPYAVEAMDWSRLD